MDHSEIASGEAPALRELRRAAVGNLGGPPLSGPLAVGTRSDPDPLASRRPPRATAGRRWLGALALLSLFATAWAHLPPLGPLVRGEVGLDGARVYRPPHPVALGELTAIDHARVHAALWPAWVIARSREARGLADHGEAEAFAELSRAVGPDPNLVALLQELRQHLRGDGDFASTAPRVLYLLWAWSHYLDRNAIPYQIHGTVRSTPWGALLSIMVYATLSDAAVTVGVDAFRIRLATRIDGTNALESYLGATGRDEAIVVTDRIEEFALSDLWPLLDPKVDDMLPSGRAFAAPVRAEARRRIDPDDFDRLQQTAYWRWQVVSTVEAIHRRRECGSSLRIHRVPWHGFEPQRLQRLRSFEEEGRCPAITAQEIELLEVASEQLERTEDLAVSVAALVAWAAEHVAIHEARHLADDVWAEAFDRPLPCGSCSEQMGLQARAELSGYLASMAWSRSASTAMYQACRTLEHERWQRGGSIVHGPHVEAMDLLTRRLGDFCRHGPPAHLAATARALEAEMLGRSDPIRLGDGFPRRLPVP